MRAQTIATSDQADTYITRAAKTVGAPGDQAVAATKVIPFVPADEELSWFHDGSGDVARGKIAQSYALTAQFLKDQGRVSTVPTTEQIASHIDAGYVEQALKDGCDK
jgi:NitT/TauT family transport system substrate-binding protein